MLAENKLAIPYNHNNTLMCLRQGYNHRWIESEVDAWIREQIAASRSNAK